MGFRVHYAQWQLLLYLFREIFLEGSYLFESNTESPTIVDCGSNIGMSILFFKMIYPKSQIIGFEPDPATFETLQSNIECNALAGVKVYPFALSGGDGMIDFYHKDDDAGSLLMSIHKIRMGGERIVVPTRKLSSFVTGPIDLLKMDIEGAEEEVIKELVASNVLSFVQQMFIEYHHHINSSEDTFSRFLALLEQSGFGYQISSDAKKGKIARSSEFQDIRIYCYRKQ
ncbi:MAG TPA: FkbM family methyltransferase [Candidatus Kapabacteria bacterium]|jgi:FkbM family methyltransferase